MTEPLFRIETPHGGIVGVAIDGHADLHPEEASMGVRFTEPRKKAFAGGRRALRLALARLDAQPLAILSDARGAPILPMGFRGSVSHKDTVAVALVDRVDPLASHVGVDVEVDRALRFDVSRRVLTDEELEASRHLEPADLQAFVLRRFSMKEAIYKAIDPFLQRYVAFREVAIQGLAPPFEARGAFHPGEADLSIEVACYEIETPSARLILSTARASLASERDRQ